MFSKDDYKEYFEQIAGLERFMIYNLNDTLVLLDDEKLRNVLEEVSEEEKTHYGYIKDIFDAILFEDEAEKRQFLRVHSLGRVRIKVKGEDDVLEAYCVNISSAGICIESHRVIMPGDVLELWIDFLDGRASQHHFGTLVWRTEINADLQIERIRYHAGIRFHA